MKKILVPTLAFILLILSGSASAFAQSPIPAPRGHVNDFANIIPDDVEQRLESTLRNHETQTTDEIAVVAIDSLGGQTVEDYTMRLAEQWKVGKKSKDNGVVLLVAMKERMMRIEVGYGLEGVLTDAKAKMIIERTLKPEFQKGNFGAGIEKGVSEIIKAIAPLPTGSVEKQNQESGSASLASMMIVLAGIGAAGLLIALLVSVILLVRRLSAKAKRKKFVRQETLRVIESIEKGLGDL